MKNTIAPVRVYQDEAHEKKTREDLAKAQAALSTLLTEWNRLDLGVCNNLTELVARTPIYYEDAVAGLVEIPKQSGRFPVSREAYINTLELPCPDVLYELAKFCRITPFCMKPELWSIDGDQIVMNQVEADALIDSQSQYSSDPDKIKLSEDLDAFVDLYNSLNVRSGSELFSSANPVAHSFFRGKFGFVGGDARGYNATLIILPDYKKKLLQ
jgi:hypothetical protein